MSTIVAIHGMWGGGWYWSNYANFFSKRGYKFINLDLPYHGAKYSREKDIDLAKLDLNSYVNYVAEEIAKLDEQPIIMGHSMGGLIAQMLANKGIGKAYVLLMPAAPKGILPISYSVLKTFFPIIRKWRFWKKVIYPDFGIIHYAVTNNMPDNMQTDIFDFMTPESGKAIFQTGLAMFDKNQTSKINFASITKPIFIVSGSKDRIVPRSVVKKIAKKYPTAEYKNYENFAHWPIEEQGWEELTQNIEEWIKKNNL